MLEIPQNRLLVKNKFYKEIIDDYFLEKENYFYDTSFNKQAIIEKFDLLVNGEQFYFIVDAKKNTITHSNGVKGSLGFDAKEFSLNRYIQIIHPAHAVAQSLYSIALIEWLLQTQFAYKDILQLSIISLIGLMQKNGKYIYYKKKSIPLFITKDNKILEYINELAVIKDFNNEPFEFRIYDGLTRRIDIETKIKHLVKANFEKHAGFSIQELRILKRYCTTENPTSEDIAKSFKIKKSTVSTYNKRILDKAEKMFEFRFENAEKAAKYFRNMNLI